MSVTAADSATGSGPAARRPLRDAPTRRLVSRRFLATANGRLSDFSNHERTYAIGLVQAWVVRRNVDGSGYGTRSFEPPARARGRDDLVERVAEASPFAAGHAPSKPQKVVFVQRDRNGPLWHEHTISHEHAMRFTRNCADNHAWPDDASPLPAAVVTAAWSLGAQGPASTQPIDWDRLRPEILEHYRALVQIDSTPGNETKVVEYLKKVLEAEGIPTKTFALDPNRANLVARLKGNGSKRPLLILAHTDVVPVQREKWPVDPFGAVMKDGYIWGRGTIDDKPKLVAMLTTMLLLKRRGVRARPRRDLPGGSRPRKPTRPASASTSWCDQHFDEIDAEFAVTEGGGAHARTGASPWRRSARREKVPTRARLVRDGHRRTRIGAAPRQRRWCISRRRSTRSARGRRRCASTRRRGPTSSGWRHQPAGRGGAIPRAARSAAARRKTFSAISPEHEPAFYSMLRTSVVPTMLKAGVGANVIPSEAEATLDIRALPGEDIGEFFEQMRRSSATRR